MTNPETTDAHLLSLGTVAELEQRADQLEAQARYIMADDYACLHGVFDVGMQASAMARKMRARAEAIRGLPYQFCRRPEQCRGKSHCPCDPACND